MENNIQPKIRFQSFSKMWKQKKIGDFYTFKNGLNKEKEFFGSGTPIVNFTDVFHNRRIFFEQLRGKVQLSTKEIQNYNVKQGDIFFTRTSETINEIGFPSVMMNDAIDTVFSGFVLRGRAIGEDPLTLNFKSYVFFTDSFREEMKKKSSMTTRALTSGTAIKKMFFNFPENKEEQMKIGKFFKDLDETISLHQQELDALKKTKQGFLQKMFPKGENIIPELRFSEFNDPWFITELSDIVSEISTGKSKHVKSDSKGNYKILGSTGVIGYGDSYEYEGNFLLTARVGANAGQLYKYSGKVKITDNTVFIKGDNLTFIHPLLEFFDLKKLSFGSGQPLIKTSELKKLKLRVPLPSEQVKIGKFFRQLDEVIELKEQELEVLIQTKKGFLQKMFV